MTEAEILTEKAYREALPLVMSSSALSCIAGRARLVAKLSLRRVKRTITISMLAFHHTENRVTRS